MHMRISKHFLADLYITRHTRETESEKRIRNTLHKTCSVELVTSPNRNNRPYAISALTHSTHIYIYIYIYIYIIGNLRIDLSRESQTWTSTSEFDHQ